MKIKGFLLIIFLIAAHINAFGQQPHFKKIEVAKKNSNLQINKVAQDSLGFIWLGSNKGLLRFNGRDYIEILLPDSLKNVPISALSISHQHVLAGFENGNILIIQYNKSLTPEIRHLTTFSITDCAFDDEGLPWFSTDGDGVFVIHPHKTYHVTNINGLPDNQVHCLESCGEAIFCGTDLGLARMTFSISGVQTETYTTANGLTDNFISALFRANDNTLLAGAQNGSVCSFNLINKSAQPFRPPSYQNTSMISSIAMLQDEVWIITRDNGAHIAKWPDNGQIQHLRFEDPEKSSKLLLVADCIMNEEAYLVFATGNNILWIVDCRFIYFTDHDGASLSQATSITCDHRGRLWFSNKNGIYRHDILFSTEQLLQLQYRSKRSDHEIISLCEGPDSAMWFGTFGSGLGRIDPKSGDIKWFTEKDGLLNDNILSLATYKNELWMATLGGACKLIPGAKTSFENFGTTSELGSSYVFCVHSGDDETLWFGTDGKGPVAYRNGSFNIIKNQYPAVGKSIVAIASDIHNNTWFYSPEDGLQLFTGEAVINIETSGNNEKSEIFAMEGNASGDIILFTSNGLGTINATTRKVQYLNNDESFNSNFLNVISIDESNHVWVGAESAIVQYKVYQQEKEALPITRLEQLLVNLQAADTTIHIFSHNQNHLTFKVAGLWFQQPDAVKIQYKLEGYNLDWVDTKDNVIVFPMLAPGSYVMHIRTYLGEVCEGGSEITYPFVITQALWQRAWFIALIIVLLILIFVGIIQARIKNLHRKEAIRRELFLSQLETLRNQVNPHFLFNSFNTLVTTIEKDKDAAIEYVERLSDYFRLILQQRDKDYITLKEELDLLDHYFYLQKMRFGKNLSVEMRIGGEYLHSLIPPMTLQILAENALKHNIVTKQRPLHIEIFVENNELIVRNNYQEKKKKETSTGVGLHNITSRYKLFFGLTVRIEKTAQYFAVYLPVIES